MLLTDAEGVDDRANATHERLPKLTLEYFREHATFNSMDYDYTQMKYEEWEVFGFRYFGTRDQKLGTKHGVVRLIMPGGSISEGQYFEGEMHGHFRWIDFDGNFKTGQYKHDKQVGIWISYDQNGNELSREDKGN